MLYWTAAAHFFKDFRVSLFFKDFRVSLGHTALLQIGFKYIGLNTRVSNFCLGIAFFHSFLFQYCFFCLDNFLIHKKISGFEPSECQKTDSGHYRSLDLEAKLSSCNFSQENKWTNLFSILMTWKHLNLNSKFKFQVFPSRQDRKTNSLVCFLGEIMARQFYFEIYWSLV